MSCSLSHSQSHSLLTVDTFAVKNVVIVCLTPVKQSAPRAVNSKCSVVPNMRKKLISLTSSQKSCSDYEVGCEWVGELRDLHDHLDPAKGRCGIACPFGYGKYVRRSEMREHTRHHCHKRMISCENCGYYNTFTIVTEKHYPICPARSPIDCPNQHCPVEGLRRHQLEQHLIYSLF